MTSSDVRKACMRLATAQIDTFSVLFDKPLWELMDICASYKEVQEENEQQRE